MKCRQLSDLRAELVRLKLELEEKQLVERAKGLIVSTKGVTEKEAFDMLKNISIEMNKSLTEAVEVILLGNRLLKPHPGRKIRKKP